MHAGWLRRGRRRRPGSPYYSEPDTLLQAVADMELVTALGRPSRVESAAYRNPLEVVLGDPGCL